MMGTTQHFLCWPAQPGDSAYNIKGRLPYGKDPQLEAPHKCQDLCQSPLISKQSNLPYFRIPEMEELDSH